MSYPTTKTPRLADGRLSPGELAVLRAVWTEARRVGNRTAGSFVYSVVANRLAARSFVKFTTDVTGKFRAVEITTAGRKALVAATLNDPTDAPIFTLKIPGLEQHNGSTLNHLFIKVRWRCPVCGEGRGVVTPSFSYDGSQRLSVDAWKNPCGHQDSYEVVRYEARLNGLNKHVWQDEDQDYAKH